MTSHNWIVTAVEPRLPIGATFMLYCKWCGARCERMALVSCAGEVSFPDHCQYSQPMAPRNVIGCDGENSVRVDQEV